VCTLLDRLGEGFRLRALTEQRLAPGKHGPLRGVGAWVT